MANISNQEKELQRVQEEIEKVNNEIDSVKIEIEAVKLKRNNAEESLHSASRQDIPKYIALVHSATAELTLGV